MTQCVFWWVFCCCLWLDRMLERWWVYRHGLVFSQVPWLLSPFGYEHKNDAPTYWPTVHPSIHPSIHRDIKKVLTTLVKIWSPPSEAPFQVKKFMSIEWRGLHCQWCNFFIYFNWVSKSSLVGFLLFFYLSSFYFSFVLFSCIHRQLVS